MTYFTNMLGKVISHINVIEYQKRGLPHAHLLIILNNEDKPKQQMIMILLFALKFQIKTNFQNY